LEENESGVTVEFLCPSCGGKLKVTDTFCGHCGKEIINVGIVEYKNDVFKDLAPTLLYYFITLLLLGLYKLTTIFPEGFEGMVIVSTIDILIVCVFWWNSSNEIKPLFSFREVKVKILMLTVGAALAGSVVISYLATLIQVAIRDDVFYNYYLFYDTSYPKFFAILFICVHPAIFEEIAFRGFLFSNLEKITSSIGALYITSFLFGIMHISIISLLWLVPIGLAFAFLRMRYNIIWYGIIGHFTYNFGVILIEFLGWV